MSVQGTKSRLFAPILSSDGPSVPNNQRVLAHRPLGWLFRFRQVAQLLFSEEAEPKL